MHYCRYAKGHWTQLQFIFEAVDPDEHFPNGCKMTCRPYSQDKVVEIVPDPSSTESIKYKVYNTKVSSRYETQKQINLRLKYAQARTATEP